MRAWCGRAAGASHAIFDLAGAQGWRLLTGDYVLREVERNVRERLSAAARSEWQVLRPALAVVTDELTYPWPVIFPAAKDRPVLFTAAATADVLLTLDRADFGGVLAAGFYGLPVMKRAISCGESAQRDGCDEHRARSAAAAADERRDCCLTVAPKTVSSRKTPPPRTWLQPTNSRR